MRQLLMEADLRDLEKELIRNGVSKNEIIIIMSEMKQHTCSIIGGCLFFNN